MDVRICRMSANGSRSVAGGFFAFVCADLIYLVSNGD